MSGASIEIRTHQTDDCHCGVPYLIGDTPSTCRHWAECDWGRIDYPDPRPDRGEVGHLLLAMGWQVGATLAGGPAYDARGIDADGRVRWQEYSATARDDRLFIHTAWPVYSHGDGIPSEDGSERPPTGSQRWTWELFPAHFADDKGPDDIFIGRWPD